MSDEQIEIVDEHNNPTGIIDSKNCAHHEGLWHRAVHVWIYTSDGRMLLQLRAPQKLLFPNTWDMAAAGHVDAGEPPLQAAIRETQEELGISLTIHDLEFIKIRKIQMKLGDILNNEFCYVYICKFDGDISDLTLQTEEVSSVQCHHPEKLSEMLKNTPHDFVSHGTYIQLIQDRL